MGRKTEDKLREQAELLLKENEAYAAFEAEISRLNDNIEGLERLVDLVIDSEEHSIRRHNGKVLWESYKSQKEKHESRSKN